MQDEDQLEMFLALSTRVFARMATDGTLERLDAEDKETEQPEE